MKSREVVRHTVDVNIYTLSTQKAHGPHIWEDDYIVEDL